MHRIGLVATLWALGCVPQLDNCADDEGCSAGRTCQEGYCLPADPRTNDASTRDRGVDAVVRDATEPDAGPTDAEVEDAGADVIVDSEVVDAVIDARVVGPDPCNGVDDDGDGQIDEGFVPGECFAGRGPCRARGADRCVEGDVVCGAVENAELAQAETCNAIDDDCDGAIDEVGENDLCCATAEVCNGEDDDCDGVVDELPAIGPARRVTRHRPAGAKVLRIAATEAHVAVLTHDAPAGRAVLYVYDLANLAADPVSHGLALNDDLPTQMIAHDGNFIIAAASVRSGVEVTRVAVAGEDANFQNRPVPLPSPADQLVLEPYADGRIAVVAHTPKDPNAIFWFQVPAAFGPVPGGVRIETPNFSPAGGFAAGLWGERLQLAWKGRDSLILRTVTNADQIEEPLQGFGAGSTRPHMSGLKQPEGDPVLLWQTRADPADTSLALRRILGGQEANLGPVRGDRPTGAPVDAARFLAGWREPGTFIGRVGLLRIADRTFAVDARLETGSALRAPEVAVGGNVVSVVWLAEDHTVFLQHHTLDCGAR